MISHSTLLTMLALLAATAAATADDRAAFLDGKIKEWFADAKPAAQVPFLTDSKGCLYGTTEGPQGMTLVAMLHANRQPICRSR